MKIAPLVISVFTILLFLPVLAQAKPNLVGTFGKWHVQTYVEGRSKVCLIWSQPEKSKGNYKRRGEVYAYVTQQPAEKRFDEISISIGYKFKKQSALSVKIKKTTFLMFTDGSTAWNRKPSDDSKMVRAMQAGMRMTVRGTSSRGTKTTDIFSLKGFSKAYTTMNKKCGVRKKKSR
ncbi:MAG: invasion associated locus B family protein [Pseudomonadota bacterium]|nr:invasion associated locus B family protein [Pseudomonadota bacterium]